MNYDLGEPYLGDAGSVVEGWVYPLINPDIPRLSNRRWFDDTYHDVRVGIGIDWGKTNYATVIAESPAWSKPQLIALEKFTDTDDPDDTVAWAADVALRWGGDVVDDDFAVVADVGYGADRNPKLYQKLGNKFYACLYPSHNKTGTRRPVTAEAEFGPCPPPPNQSSPVVVVDRTASLKVLIAALRRPDYQIARLGEVELDDLDRHARNIAIVLETDEKTGQPIETAQTLGPDHYLHSTNYATIALEWARRHQAFVGELEGDPHGHVEDADPGLVSIPTFEEVADVMGMLTDPFSGYDY